MGVLVGCASQRLQAPSNRLYSSGTAQTGCAARLARGRRLCAAPAPAMLLSRTKLRLNTLRVLPPAIQLSPLIMLAQLPSTRKAWGTRIVAISSPAQQRERHSRQAPSQVCRNSQVQAALLPQSGHRSASWSQTSGSSNATDYKVAQTVTQEMQDACQAAARLSSQQATHNTPVAVLSSRKLMKYHVLLWMSKL